MSQRTPSLSSGTAQPAVIPPPPLETGDDAEMRQLQWAGLSLERQLALWGLTLLALGLSLYFLSPVLAPFVAGTALGYLLDPVADRLQRLGLSRLGAAGLLLVVFLLVVGTAAVILVPILSHQLAGFITSLPGYLQTLHGLLTQWSERFTSDSINGWLQEFGLGGAAASFDAQKYINDLTSQGATLLGDFVKSLLWRGYALINVVSLIVITPVVAFYMLVDWDHMVAIIDDLIPPRHREDVRSLARDIDRALAGFVRGQSLVCLFLGIWYAGGLSAIGLNFGFLIGVIAGFLSFIPYVGSVTAFVLSIIVAIVQGWPHINLPIEAVAIVTTGLIMDGYVLSPRLVGASVGLHPVWIMFALLAFGALFGFTGLIVAVPVAAALGAFMRFLAKRYRGSALYQHPIPDRA
ncbi:AI-2E family transporter [Methylocystis sp. L43]|jgi:predicted PurR-regulated permease PerM|uniref:AI-2E family transporter n=1 Tax=unclassified Methylocystis TaxID=2625913 RepID=UPI0018C24604|nr:MULTISPECIES: AI-2E family transporter [unclassified Methylocystis]MBG0797970.1 AI-2E family transporter [Methylocystis sp. L43]MBG0805444.1 AI-2E family transporter [Methylocystis sp. H15]